MDQFENKAIRIINLNPQHNEFVVSSKEYFTGRPYQANITSNFDSGNLRELIVIANKPNHVRPIISKITNSTYFTHHQIVTSLEISQTIVLGFTFELLDFQEICVRIWR